MKDHAKVNRMPVVVMRHLSGPLDTMAPWWLHPLAPILLLAVPVALLAYLANDRIYQLWGTPKFVTGETTTIFIVGAAAFVLGVTLAPRVTKSDDKSGVADPAEPMRLLEVIARWAFRLAILSYCMWLLVIVARGTPPQLIMAVINLQPSAVAQLKDYLQPVGGLTTLTQLAPLAVAARMILFRAGQRKGIYQALFLIGLGFIRAFFNGERLALIEVLVPVVVVWAMTLQRQGRLRVREVRRRQLTLPILAPAALWMLFATFEFTRSWQYYKNVVDVSFPVFATQRLAGYYTTSINNSALYFELLRDRSHPAFYSIAGLWDAPGMSRVIGIPEIAGVYVRHWWTFQLQSQANPEFNNTGTFVTVFSEWGLFGSVLYWGVLGLAVGAVFKWARSGSLIGIATYACIFVGVLELVRFTYWVQGRFTPLLAILLIIIVSVIIKDRRSSRGAWI